MAWEEVLGATGRRVRYWFTPTKLAVAQNTPCNCQKKLKDAFAVLANIWAITTPTEQKSIFKPSTVVSWFALDLLYLFSYTAGVVEDPKFAACCESLAGCWSSSTGWLQIHHCVWSVELMMCPSTFTGVTGVPQLLDIIRDNWNINQIYSLFRVMWHEWTWGLMDILCHIVALSWQIFYKGQKIGSCCKNVSKFCLRSDCRNLRWI